jgi:serine/threonine protein kinase
VINLRNPSKLTIIKKYQLGKILGQGTYAIVRVGTHIETNELAAIKIYDRFDQYNTIKLKNIKLEAYNLLHLNHPNIVKLLNYFESERYVCLIMEYGGSTSLNTFIEQQKNLKLSEEHARPLIKQIVSALAYLHGKSIAHRDIKLDNILIKDNIIKLIDFGFSCPVEEHEKVAIFCGTPAYLAPEIIKNKPFHPLFSDIWAVGVLIYRMIGGFFPFQGTPLSSRRRRDYFVQ